MSGSVDHIMLRDKDPYTTAEKIIDNFAEVFQKTHL